MDRPGATGRSAYEIALLHGFRGTQADWLKTLVGRKGESIQGPVGPKGDKGDPGRKGDKGDQGDKGDKGDPGTADLEPKATQWRAEPIRDQYDLIQEVVVKSDLGQMWRGVVYRDASDLIEEIVLTHV